MTVLLSEYMDYGLHLATIAEDDFVQVSLDSKLSLLQVSWKQHPVVQSQFRNVIRLGLYLTLKHHLKLWLVDAHKMHYLEAADQQWLAQKLRPFLRSGKIAQSIFILTPESLAMTDPHVIYYGAGLEPEEEASGNVQVLFDLESAYLALFDDKHLF